MEYQPTPDNSNRLYLYEGDMPEENHKRARLKEFLDVLSIWSGADKHGDGFTSWELPSTITKEMITTYLRRLGCSTAFNLKSGQVKVLRTPISDRYCRVGDEARLDIQRMEIKCAGSWFRFDERWLVEQL
mgnify:CR=1 FL=1